MVGGCWVQREKQGRLSWDCKMEVFRQEVQNAGNLQLNVVLLRTCMGEQQAFCNFPEAGKISVTSPTGSLIS